MLAIDAREMSVAGRESGWPAPTAEAVSLLVQRGVRCLGTDTPSVGAVEDGYPAHVAGLAHGLIYVEGLCRLEQLPVRGAEFLFLPISLRGGTGAPGRADRSPRLTIRLARRRARTADRRRGSTRPPSA